jgi:ATP-dependent helicase/nuclease subunit A
MVRPVNGPKPLLPLRPAQRTASDPEATAWVSASAGTGKTQVLTARVLRLLLGGAEPSHILCLTFTKAAAAEMQTRIYDRLAAWVRAGDNALASDLDALGVAADAATRDRARRLFAKTLDARGGLRIETLHAFAQSLLASFPVEARVTPGFTALDDRSAIELRQRVLTEALTDGDDAGFRRDVEELAVRQGEAGVAKSVAKLLRHGTAFATLGAPEPLLRQRLGLPAEGDAATAMAAALGDFDIRDLSAFAEAQRGWGTKTGLAAADTVAAWTARDAAGRVEAFADLRALFFRKDSARAAPKGRAADIPDTMERICAAIERVSDLEARFRVLDVAARHLRVGSTLSAAYTTAKDRAGVLDFDDMILRAAAMLGTEDMGAWVRFKLDRGLDHILVDEGQDTNAAQWEIVSSLAEEFFAGVGARDETVSRTLFAVGDYKQSIYGFQGADPEEFLHSRNKFRERAEDAGQRFENVALAESFRSGKAVLDVVDRVIADIGYRNMGLEEEVEPHRVGRAGDPTGRVVLWPAVVDPKHGGEGADGGEQDWLAETDVTMAQRLAKQVRHWLDDPAFRLSTGARPRPQDILVLVRQRREFVGALVAALHGQGVPVAGVDRLRLTEPLAVQDCLALVRFALQPEDDLTLAALLTSPFVGLDQDALFELAQGRTGSVALRQRLKGSQHVETKAWLDAVLALGDRLPPYEFLETILSGPLQGRAKLLARLGEEARDGIDAVLAQALAFEADHAPSLQGFLAWIETDEVELKRDPETAGTAVRIMTVHGAKGLQAPIVVLADAARTPQGSGEDQVLLEWGPLSEPLPVFFGGKDNRIDEISREIEHRKALADEEYWRLLYVALTRAEDMLFVGGALGAREAEPGPGSWHAATRTALAGLGAVEVADPIWGDALQYVHGVPPALVGDDRPAAIAPALPDWARALPPAEPIPPRPLSPSQLAADDVVSRPPGKAMLRAARRGTLLHKLFERLPEVAPDRRRAAALRWLAAQAPDFDAAARDDIADTALGILERPDFAAIFGPDALAEAPVAAVVGGIVVAGAVDRLLIEAGRVQVVDFKTGLSVPADLAAVPPYHLRQMGAYAAALAQVFPGRRVDAALLYTEAARLIELPPDVLAANAPVAPVAPAS